MVTEIGNFKINERACSIGRLHRSESLDIEFRSRASVQKEVFDPESRNSYVSTLLSWHFALPFTGTIDSPTIKEPLDA